MIRLRLTGLRNINFTPFRVAIIQKFHIGQCHVDTVVAGPSYDSFYDQ